MPAQFSNIHAKFRTPDRAILLFTILACGIALSGQFSTLATLSAMARLLTYIGAAISLLSLRKKLPAPDSFRIPGGPLVPVLTILLCFYLLTAASKAQWIAGSIALVVGLILYGSARLSRSN